MAKSKNSPRWGRPRHDGVVTLSLYGFHQFHLMVPLQNLIARSIYASNFFGVKQTITFQMYQTFKY